MLIDFFYTLRSAKLPVSVKEYLMLLEALQAGVVGPNSCKANDGEGAYKIDDFYYLSRTILVKDEKHYDKFDRAFASYFKGVEMIADFTKEVPLEWLRKNLELELSAEDKAKIEKMGWDELMETLKKRFEEQKERHEGGSKWIGTGGTSPFGANGFNPQGIRIGQEKSRNKSAVKVWDQRAYKDYDDTQELGTRNIKVALRRLRKFARQGNVEELDLDVVKEAAAQKCVGQFFFVIRGNKYQRSVLGFDEFARFVNIKLHAVNLAQQVVWKFNVGFVNLIDQQGDRFIGRKSLPQHAFNNVVVNVFDLFVA